MAGVVAVVGPTAAGKSDLALALAHRLGGDVINADSMQLYRGMDIGTAKLSLAEREGVAHHLLDVWDIGHASDVASYQVLARRQIDALLAAGRWAILAGGSGLYVRAALDALEFPGTDATLRGELEEQLRQLGPGVLHQQLGGADPAAAAAILPGNGRRIVRALEVISLTGSSFTATLPAPSAVYDVTFVGLDLPDLDTRVAERTDRMWEAGLVEEVRRLEARGLRQGRTAARALGYAQILRWFDGTLPDEQSAKAETVRSTCRFVRKQRSWFRRDPRIQWLRPAEPDSTGRTTASTARTRAKQADAVERLIAARHR